MKKYVQLKKHVITKAYFEEKEGKEKKESADLNVAGNIIVPKDFKENRSITVKLNLSLGNEEDRILLTLDTLSYFEVKEECPLSETDEILRKACLSIALTELRKTAKDVSVAYGRPPLDLPPFDDEIE